MKAPRGATLLASHRLRRVSADIDYPMVTEETVSPLMQRPPCLAAIPAQPLVSQGTGIEGFGVFVDLY